MTPTFGRMIMTKRTNGIFRIIKSTGLAICISAFGLGGLAIAENHLNENYKKKQEKLGERFQEYVFGTPEVPTADWVMVTGGRYYDNWMNALDIDPLETTHPSWPASNTEKQGANTWRCKACHGWDYKGVNGDYAEGSWKTGIIGVNRMQGSKPSDMVPILRNATHQYTPDMITDEQILRIGLFISRGLHDTDAYINPETGNTNGIESRGARIFQNVCASCHGFQGTKLDWGSSDEPAYVGTEANANPWEVLHKIRNGHPGVEMVAMRPFGMDVAVDILTYIRTLPEK